MKRERWRPFPLGQGDLRRVTRCRSARHIRHYSKWELTMKRERNIRYVRKVQTAITGKTEGRILQGEGQGDPSWDEEGERGVYRAREKSKSVSER